ncbi:cytochrome-c peroxidase [Flavimarina sp. Hel_I_48]|uniref:cytochrome-c peroxidase n=1 Tax=Flavimarina sp. Hel_I_48 TaxID=1392488 RepID=UPI0004DFCDF0|nr:cytochrome c peroxidase [Flavimarina sp. Hel_I_48]
MKKNLLFCLIALLLLVTWQSCKNRSAEQETAQLVPNWDYAQDYYLTNIKNTDLYLDSVSRVPIASEQVKHYFKKARIAFKKAEPYASYLNPEVGHRANGPALPVFTEDTERVLEPLGLQKIEESLYEGGVDSLTVNREIQLTRGLINVLRKNIENRKLDPQRFFIATHQQLLRILSFSMANFDTPVSGEGLREASISLLGLLEVYDHSIKALVQKNDKALDSTFTAQIQRATEFIGKNPDFKSFDRFSFIRDYLNPITRSWVAIREVSDIWEPVDNQPFNFDAPTFFENNSFNVNYFTPPANRNPSDEQIALGKRLFFDPQLSSNGAMACATCHIPDKAYADGLVASLDNTGKKLMRNTPTLINSVFQKGFFWDGRSNTLLDQISGVFTNKLEFNGSVHEFSTALTEDSTYVSAFNKVFGPSSKKNSDVIKAISSYIATLNSFDSKFDRNMRGEENTFTASEKRGFNLFMGEALCATCHFMPLTSGTVPPFYKETEKEVIGVPATAANKSLDTDEGFYWRYGNEIHRGMFKTPSIRNAGLTAPYMHNGVYATLEEVIDFYNKGGGGGLGFDLPQQTLPFDNLDLSIADQKALVAFIKTLTATDI